MLAHTGGAEALDAPTWLVAYGAAAAVLVVTAGLRGRLVVAAARDGDEALGEHDPEPAGSGVSDRATPGAARRAVDVAGRVLGLGTLGLVVAAALVGPDAPGANLAPSAVLVVWWVGLPSACALAGDVMTWLDPFGTLARGAAGLVPGRARAAAASDEGPFTRPRLAAVTAATSLLAFTWWALAFHDGREPRALGWFLLAYTAAATAGAVAWGRAWLRSGEGFGALSASLAAARRRARRPDHGHRPEVPTVVVGPLVAVWLGGLAFDLFRGTRGWVDLAGSATDWTRTALATACLVVAVVGAGALVAGTVALARGRIGAHAPTEAVDRAVTGAWLATTAGAVVAHGLPLVLVSGQFVLALVSDPFGRGWDLFGTADRTIDYSPLSASGVGIAQIVVATAGACWGVVVAARSLAGDPARGGLHPRAARRALWLTGGACACTAAAVVALLSTNLE